MAPAVSPVVGCAVQVGSQPATEALPLVMEPESRMYTSPLVVLDFQSLYPSLIIAYNLCYTTCIGRPQHADAPSDAPVRMGVTSYALPPGVLVPGGPADPEGLIIAPNGVAYLPQAVRPGVLPRMLHEILATRVMVKDAMKRTPASDRVRLVTYWCRQAQVRGCSTAFIRLPALGPQLDSLTA